MRYPHRWDYDLTGPNICRKCLLVAPNSDASRMPSVCYVADSPERDRVPLTFEQRGMAIARANEAQELRTAALVYGSAPRHIRVLDDA